MDKKKENIFNAGEIEAQRNARQLEQIEADKQRRITFGIVFSSREGFDVLKELKDFCHADFMSYVQGDQVETAFREGERNVFQFILSNLSDEMKSQIAKEI